jgi:hypothetical protein
MHYWRWLRHGDPLATANDGRATVNSNGYRTLHRPGHPLADKHGTVYEHRVVLYAIIGPGTHPCHWCRRPVTWGKNLYVDHVNDDPLDNAPANLVQSCNGCNINRPKAKGLPRRPRTTRRIPTAREGTTR